MDLLTKHLLSAKTEKMKVVATKGKDDSNSEEEANYMNNQGDFEAIAKEIKVRTTTTRLVTRIGSKEIG